MGRFQSAYTKGSAGGVAGVTGTIGKSIDDAGAITLTLAGKFNGASLGELRREIEGARRMQREIVIDLGEVTLVDRPCLRFLAASPDIRVVNCPEYIQPWIARDSSS
jgi:hypothetical protein